MIAQLFHVTMAHVWMAMLHTHALVFLGLPASIVKPVSCNIVFLFEYIKLITAFAFLKPKFYNVWCKCNVLVKKYTAHTLVKYNFVTHYKCCQIRF